MINLTELFATPMADAQIPNHVPLCAALSKLFFEKEREGDRYRYHQRRATQFGDLFEFIVTAGEIDGVAPSVGKTTLRSYFEELSAD